MLHQFCKFPSLLVGNCRRQMLSHRSNGGVCEMAIECDDDEMMEIDRTSKAEDLARQKKYGIDILWNNIEKRYANSLGRLRVCLFNVHNNRFPKLLVDKKVKTIRMIELSSIYAKNLKKFAQENKKHDCDIRAYREDINSILWRGLKYRTIESNVDRLFAISNNEHEIMAKEQPIRLGASVGADATDDPTVAIVIVPMSNQLSLLTGLYASLLAQHMNSYNTIYKYGPIDVFTFISGQHYAMLFERLDRFTTMTKPMCMWRSLLHRLFEIRQLSNNDAFNTTSFDPPFVIPKLIPCSRELLSKTSIHPEHVYGIALKPRTHIHIANTLITKPFDDNYIDFDTSAIEPNHVYNLLRYHVWQSMCNLKSRKRDTVADLLRKWFPEIEGRDEWKTLQSTILSSKMHALNANDIDSLFDVLRPRMVLVGDESTKQSEFMQMLKETYEHFGNSAPKNFAD